MSRKSYAALVALVSMVGLAACSSETVVHQPPVQPVERVERVEPRVIERETVEKHYYEDDDPDVRIQIEK